MREGLSRGVRSAPAGIGALGLVLILTSVPAFGQIPQPEVSDIHKRSGLITRFVPIDSHLPPDPRRDNFYDTRFGHHPDTKHPNSVKGGGLYGKYWKAHCTASVYPYFLGSPGQGTIGPDCQPWPRPLRFFQNVIRPFRPVGMYYDQGSFVPLHDLDPLVPGPGPYPIPWYYTGPRGG